MRVIHVVSRMVSNSSGPSHSVPGLCRALAELGVEVELHMLGTAPSLDSSIKVVTYPCIPGITRLGWSPAMKRGLMKAAESADILHSHSLWMLPNVYPGVVARRREGCKLVVSPRGTLSEWAMRRSRFRKKIVWHMGQRQTLASADCIHATAENELAEVRTQKLSNPVAVVPNGVEPVAVEPAAGGKEAKKLLFLSRIHPKKGIETLLHAWAELANHFPDWHLVIAGPDEHRYARAMRGLVDSLGLVRCRFVGEVSGGAKSRLFSEADLFVLPTRSENFGMVVAEALSHGVPAIVSRAAPWSGLASEGCGWWVDEGRAALVQALQHAMSLRGEELQARGKRGQQWMRRDFSWSSVGERMLETYRWLRDGSGRPAWVDLA